MTAAAISPARILRDLDQLWVELGKGQDADHPSAVLRACAMTLVVATEGEAAEDDVELGETLAQLMRDHPSRLIVLRLNENAGEQLDARVVAQCWMPFGRRQQICCERIEISGSAGSLAGVPPVLQALTVPDLPVALWCRNRKVADQPAFRAILSQADKLIVDSAETGSPAAQLAWIHSLLGPDHQVADLAWTRLTRWRESIAQVFDEPEGLAHIGSIDRVRIGFEGHCAPMASVYLSAWLEKSLGRPLTISASCGDPSGRTRVNSVELMGDSICYSIKVGADRSVQVHGAFREARTLFPRLGDYELLREELSVLGPDPIYDAVLALAPGMARRLEDGHTDPAEAAGHARDGGN
ncbi:MAG: glucose-6-phosphate dehydrogenase assembly protein OpcA [Bryobacteraceae bacterium]